MKKIVAHEDYEIYHVNKEKFYALDKENMDLIETAFLKHESYGNIPDGKEVECFEMDDDNKANTLSINMGKKVRMSMNQLSSLAYWI